MEFESGRGWWLSVGVVWSPYRKTSKDVRIHQKEVSRDFYLNVRDPGRLTRSRTCTSEPVHSGVTDGGSPGTLQRVSGSLTVFLTTQRDKLNLRYYVLTLVSTEILRKKKTSFVFLIGKRIYKNLLSKKKYFSHSMKTIIN